MRIAPYILFLICGISVALFQWQLAEAGEYRGLGFGIFLPYLVLVFGPCSLVGAYIAGKNRDDPVLIFLAIFTVCLYVFQGLTFLGVLGVAMDYIAQVYALSTFVAPIIGYFYRQNDEKAV